MENFYYYHVQNNNVQPFIFRQPQAVVIHTNQHKRPITVDMPPQNIIVRNDEPQPIIVRQQNPNVVIQNAQDMMNMTNTNLLVPLTGTSANSSQNEKTPTLAPGTNSNINYIADMEMNDFMNTTHAMFNNTNAQMISNCTPSKFVPYVNDVPMNNNNLYNYITSVNQMQVPNHMTDFMTCSTPYMIDFKNTTNFNKVPVNSVPFHQINTSNYAPYMNNTINHMNSTMPYMNNSMQFMQSINNDINQNQKNTNDNNTNNNNNKNNISSTII